MIAFENVLITQLDDDVWCATATILPEHLSQLGTKVSLKERELKRQIQRMGVRSLLYQLLDKLGITDTLNESAFPYRLLNTGYYVCFSHSNNQVGVIISAQRSVGIDIESNAIKWSVAKRYYHDDELNVLLTLSADQTDILSRLLWQTKESFAKIRQNPLAHELGLSYLPLLQKLIDDDVGMNVVSSEIAATDYHNADYQIKILCHGQMVIVF